MANDIPIASWAADLPFERIGPVRRALKRFVVHPFGNWCPAFILRGVLHILRSELAAANWADPGGWQSMVIAYAERRRRFADKLLCTLGTIPMALRNRRRLATRVLERLIADVPEEPVHIFGLGAGPGHTISGAIRASSRQVHATLVDLSADAVAYGRRMADEEGVSDVITFIHGDVRDVERMLERPPDIAEMLGICEYLDDAHVRDITASLSEVMAPGSHIVVNSISRAHGTERFFSRVLGLELIHRSPADIQALLAPAGFTDFVSVAEPLGVFDVMVGRKRG
jgi:hypothetical protein